MRTTFTALLWIGLGGVAQAHVYLMTPSPRNMESLKEGPCGAAGSVRTTNVTEYRPGEEITVTFRDEFNHTGHYRIAFDTDGVNDFVDPAAENDFDNSPAVLKDAILDEPGNKTYTVKVTLPNVECTNCTLQIIQVMTEATGFDVTRDVYYQCADIVLKAGAAPQPAEPDAGMPVDSVDAAPEPTPETPPVETPAANDDYEVGPVSACEVAVGAPGGGVALVLIVLVLASLSGSRRRR
jgi:Lytic polysaccharide mono-oxygenase, cellulose-degrading